jgi:hypothetical protein
MTAIPLLVLLAALAPLVQVPDTEPSRLFERGRTWEQFVDGVRAQRELWLSTQRGVTVSPDLVERVRRAAGGLQLVVIAEDRCPDSAHSIPYVAWLAAAAQVPLRIVDRAVGESLMNAHRTPDGRTATPTVVLLRNGRDVGAWVERPAVLQEMFLSMAVNPDNARRFSERGAWYESDHGVSVLTEIVVLIERTGEAQ